MVQRTESTTGSSGQIAPLKEEGALEQGNAQDASQHRSGSFDGSSASRRRPASAPGRSQGREADSGVEAAGNGSSPKKKRTAGHKSAGSPTKTATRASPKSREQRGNSRFFYTAEARNVSAQLATLASSSAEGALARKGLLGDDIVDSVQDPEGVCTDRDGKYNVSVRMSAIQRRNTSEMRRSLAGLRDSGRSLGISIDVSRGKSLSGRMQGEKWVDDEIEQWKLSASRALSTLDGVPTEELMAQGLPGVRGPQADLYADQWAVEERAAEELHKIKGTWNKLAHDRRSKQRQLEVLREELGQMQDYAQWMDRADGEKSRVQGVMSTLQEGISDYDMQWQKEREERDEMEHLSKVLRGEVEEGSRRVETVREELGRLSHDVEGLTLQLRHTLHGIEKSLGQGKIHTMRQVRHQMQRSYVDELESKVSQIKGQIEVKKSLQEYEMRLSAMTDQMQKQFDPKANSPRRNTLRKKAEDFEAAFREMKRRLGDQDLESIVELLKQQQVSQQSWKEAVAEHETRVKGLEDELEGLVRQKKAIMLKSAAKERDDGGGARVQVHIEWRLDQQLDRLEEAMGRVEAVRDLTSKVGECVKHNICRVRACVGEVEAPEREDKVEIQVEGKGGLLEMLSNLTEEVAALLPNQEEWQMLQEMDDRVGASILRDEQTGTSGRSFSSMRRLMASTKLVRAFGESGNFQSQLWLENDEGSEADVWSSRNPEESALGTSSLASTGLASALGSNAPSPTKSAIGASLGLLDAHSLDAGRLSEGHLGIGDLEAAEEDGDEKGGVDPVRSEGGGGVAEKPFDPINLVLPPNLRLAIQAVPVYHDPALQERFQSSPAREFNCRVPFHLEDYRHVKQRKEESDRDQELLDETAAPTEGPILTRDDVKRKSSKTMQKRKEKAGN